MLITFLWLAAHSLRPFACTRSYFHQLVHRKILGFFVCKVVPPDEKYFCLPFAVSTRGEIAVICQDVKLLKERFDQHVPLGKSLFSSQTSFMLASLASSWKNLAPDQVETVAVGNGDQLEPENNRDYEYVPEEDEAAREDCKALLADDGWELFDSSEVNE